MKIRQVYYHYEQWEEYEYGMWRITRGKERRLLIEKAIEFMMNVELYGNYMIQAVEDWPISCEQNLTCPGINKQAWIGQAACCIAIYCPEDVTRFEWRFLDKKKQDEANAKANVAISYWKDKYLKSKKIFEQKELFGGFYA